MACCQLPALAQALTQREDIRSFIGDMSSRHGFEENALLELFAQVKNSEDVLRFIAPGPPGMKKNWTVYRSRFLDQLRINEGVKFWRRHEADVARASATYGVPQEIIVSIIGVETVYGRNTGNFRVIDALTTLGFNYPRRAAFFRSELEAFLLHTREYKIDPLSVLGSYAGAIGLPQFMPSSITKFAVDFNNDGLIDLRASPVDAIGSVAKFLADHGWMRDKPATYAMRFEANAKIDELVAAGILPQFSPAQLLEYGARAASDTPDDEPLALIDLPNGDNPTIYVLGAKNFYVITRYNRSSFYAMSVLELASALRSRLNAPPVADKPKRTQLRKKRQR